MLNETFTFCVNVFFYIFDLSITNEGMHFKGQFLPKHCYNILGKKVKVIELAFRFVYWIEYENEEYFISEDLFNNY